MGNRAWGIGHGDEGKGNKAYMHPFYLSHAFFFLLERFCPMPNAQCPMPNAQCPFFQSRRTFMNNWLSTSSSSYPLLGTASNNNSIIPPIYIPTTPFVGSVPNVSPIIIIQSSQMRF
ncbi:hypothetical protein NSTC745_02593 [Nostoc sp. DSM 114161]|jgi:hypothetical protein